MLSILIGMIISLNDLYSNSLGSFDPQLCKGVQGHPDCQVPPECKRGAASI